MGKMLKTSADNRKCMFPNCTIILSIYNHDAYCHIHRGEVHQEQTINNLMHKPGQSPLAGRQI
jgi:hypothetical protein